MKINSEKKRHIINWLKTTYDGKMTMLDYCYEVYYEILDYCWKHNMHIQPKKEVFFGHLISILYQTYTLR